ncbi:tRNA1(Val) (adenine(37)-N6)-methyltransferase [Costertonia aggregata]|uniref:tRNA1(Val) (adenine(37)-N6)-methyltransferase n=1 Tax=Costertonia aggregata TaxID=343403 RepID=A0A7H9AMU2_9FLAO|nr:methyltransferase [Costertonia aggregata]QLG44761.1 methyltransferase [Costertonia aggregata]
MEKPFKFKQFMIRQNRCAMKVGTDGVLLGAWASLPVNTKAILDIGSGTGLIALMLAQRSSAEIIDAIEIDGDAYEQCVDNFESSPWGDRLFCYHASLDEFTDEIDDKYDMIVSNPPFYSEDVSTGNIARNTARQNRSLPFSKLLESISKLLSPEGVFAVIIPIKEEKRFFHMAESVKLYPKRATRVRGNQKSEIKRSLLEFGFHTTKTMYHELTIETDRHIYTPEYVALTKEFYLKM